MSFPKKPLPPLGTLVEACASDGPDAWDSCDALARWRPERPPWDSGDVGDPPVPTKCGPEARGHVSVGQPPERDVGEWESSCAVEPAPLPQSDGSGATLFRLGMFLGRLDPGDSLPPAPEDGPVRSIPAARRTPPCQLPSLSLASARAGKD